FHQRMFVLNMQVRHLDRKSIATLGQWLLRRWKGCQSCKELVERALGAIGVDEEVLQAEWKAQVQHQTKPAPHASFPQLPMWEITKVLKLEELVAARSQTISSLEIQLMIGRVNDITTFNIEVAEACSQLDKLKDTLRRCRAALGVDDRANLARLKTNKYLHIQMNALALKTRLRDRLHQRKFEREHLERSYHQGLSSFFFDIPSPTRANIYSYSEQRLHTHAESALQRREPTILHLISSYNSLCDQLKALIRQRRHPHGTVAPHHISREGIFNLDGDDDIWKDVGLGDDVGDPPAWLSDEDVRAGIRLLLEKDRCSEEEERLRR
ncbi:hypothetical protein HYDPIDRAFT_64446, partial [Hydnomerulius pinastri MD-312]